LFGRIIRFGTSPDLVMLAAPAWLDRDKSTVFLAAPFHGIRDGRFDGNEPSRGCNCRHRGTCGEFSSKACSAALFFCQQSHVQLVLLELTVIVVVVSVVAVSKNVVEKVSVSFTSVTVL